MAKIEADNLQRLETALESKNFDNYYGDFHSDVLELINFYHSNYFDPDNIGQLTDENNSLREDLLESQNRIIEIKQKLKQLLDI